MTIEIGSPAPDFILATDGNGEISLSGLKGRKVVVYFYPKDSTPGCTREAQDFRDLKKDFDASGTEIIGMSKDSVKSHDNFKSKQDLNFPLASDPEGETCEAYGVWVEKSMYGRKYMGIERATFLIDEKGIIRNIWRKVKVKNHAADVLEAAKKL